MKKSSPSNSIGLFCRHVNITVASTMIGDEVHII